MTAEVSPPSRRNSSSRAKQPQQPPDELHQLRRDTAAADRMEERMEHVAHHHRHEQGSDYRDYPVRHDLLNRPASGVAAGCIHRAIAADGGSRRGSHFGQVSGYDWRATITGVRAD